MKFSYNWISELVEELHALPGELSQLVTLKTAESEGVQEYAAHLSSVCAAAVLSVEPIEGSKNRKAVVDTGLSQQRTVVCGAPNCRPGMITAYVPSGTRLNGREIRKATISGVESDGMLASGAELGINRDGEGILELPGLECGTPLGLVPDYLIEIDNKSLTHRPDLWGHHGMAREVAAILRSPLRDPVRLELVPAGPAPIAVTIESFDLCPRYSALVCENVVVQPSPLWLQYRLQAIGLNPINNVVDVTNYVMAEIAQPMHAFDADKLRGGITVRAAKPGEQIAALNGETYQLSPKDLVIADDAGAIAVAGVIGGAGSAIGGGTTRIVLESANFHPGSVRKTSSALKLRTDASMRFEKAQDPANTVRGLARALELLREVSPGIRVVEGVADVARLPLDPDPIDLPLAWLDRKLGRHVERSEVEQILKSLQFGVTDVSEDLFRVQVPSWRATKDISIKDDLVEEIGRMIGYSSIPPSAPLLPAVVPLPNEMREYQHSVRQFLAAQGFDEVYNYSFLSEEALPAFGLNPDDHVRVLNPIAAGQNLMRATLVPGITRNIIDNSRFFDSFRLFELGVETHKRADSLPEEVNHLIAAIYAKDANAEGLFELKRVAESLVKDIEIRPAEEARPFEHPARSANIHLGDRVIGTLFEMHPSVVERGRAAILDLDLDVVLLLGRRETKYKPLQRFPSSAFDLSIICNEHTLVGNLQRELLVLAGEQLERIDFVRQYSGPPLAEGNKSVSFRVTVAAPDRTFSSEEVGAIRSRIIEGMRTLGYELRV